MQIALSINQIFSDFKSKCEEKIILFNYVIY